MEILGILFFVALLCGLFSKLGEVYVEVARIVPLNDPEVEKAISTLRSYGYLKKDAKRYVEEAYRDGSDDLVSGALAKIEV